MTQDDFTLTVAGTTYRCWRLVSGTSKLTQHIYVEGQGSKADSATYGPGGHRIESMASVARLIASEVIAESGR